jgi:hypothetical protein
VLNTGDPVTMTKWIDRRPALLDMWYGGQEGGHALASILFGDANPSGKLPVSLPKRFEDGSATAGVFAPVLDSEKRPITAGGFVKTGPVIFQDISEKAGLTVWTHKMGTPEKPYILETIGSGVACSTTTTTAGSTSTSSTAPPTMR